MDKKDYSKSFKRKALLDYAHGKKFDEIFDETNSTDKKYCAKLLHKWKKRMYKNKEILVFLQTELSKQDLKEEIENLNYPHEHDDIANEFKIKYKK